MGHNRVLCPSDPQDVSDFFDDFAETELGELLSGNGLLTTEVFEQIFEAAKERFGHSDLSMREFETAGGHLYRLGAFLPKPEPVVVEPEVPRDSKGRKLSPKALRYRDYVAWSNSHSMQEVQERRRREPEFAAFYHEFMGLGQAGDGVETQGTTGTMKTEDKDTASQAEIDFARAYQRMSTEETKRLSRAATNPGGAAAAAEFVRQVEKCISKGIL